MQELSLLNKKCLTNMPMMLDIIAITTNNLKKSFDSVYDNIKIYIQRLLESDMKSHFLFDNKYVERGKMICLEENEGDIVRPWLSISYKLPFTYLCRKKEYAFDAGLEYVVNEDYNVIRFYLSDISYNCILWDDIVKDNLLNKRASIPIFKFSFFSHLRSLFSNELIPAPFKLPLDSPILYKLW